MITDKMEVITKLKNIIRMTGKPNYIDISYLKPTSNDEEYYFFDRLSVTQPINELIIHFFELCGKKNHVVFSELVEYDQNQIGTKVLGVINYDLTGEKEIAPTNVLPSEMQTIHDLYKNQLNWYIEQTKLNEERLDKRLKEIMKSQNLSSEIDAQKIDFSGILPHIMPVLEVLKNLGSK